MPAAVDYARKVVDAAGDPDVAGTVAATVAVDISVAVAVAAAAVAEKEEGTEIGIAAVEVRQRHRRGYRWKGNSRHWLDVGPVAAAGSHLVGEVCRWGWRRIACQVLEGCRR